jgi:hypothetical protein
MLRLQEPAPASCPATQYLHKYMNYFWGILYEIELFDIIIFTVYLCNLRPLFFLLGLHRFSKIRELSQDTRCQLGDIKQVPYWGPTNVRRHRTKFNSLGDLSLGICAPVFFISVYNTVRFQQFPSKLTGTPVIFFLYFNCFTKNFTPLYQPSLSFCYSPCGT